MQGKYLGTPRAWRNDTPSSHIYDGPHNEFNERTPPWMWEEGTPFFILREYLRITHYAKPESSIELREYQGYRLNVIYNGTKINAKEEEV